MKTLRFHFCHPVKGTVMLINRVSPGLNRIQSFDTDSVDIANVDISGLTEGQWTAALAWEHEGKDFCYEKDFVVSRLFQ